MKKIFFSAVALTVFLMLAFCSCSSPTPVAAKYWESQYENNEYFKFVSYKDVDKLMGEKNGVPVCKLIGVIEVECIKDGGWVKIDDDGYMDRLFALQQKREMYDFLGRDNMNTQISVGNRYKTVVTTRLTKYESGWKKD